MTDRAEDLRTEAARCLALAQTMTDSTARAELIHMADRFLALADRQVIDFDGILQIFNDQQLGAASGSKPVVQQQQQIQPSKDEQ